MKTDELKIAQAKAILQKYGNPNLFPAGSELTDAEVRQILDIAREDAASEEELIEQELYEGVDLAELLEATEAGPGADIGNALSSFPLYGRIGLEGYTDVQGTPFGIGIEQIFEDAMPTPDEIEEMLNAIDREMDDDDEVEDDTPIFEEPDEDTDEPEQPDSEDDEEEPDVPEDEEPEDPPIVEDPEEPEEPEDPEDPEEPEEPEDPEEPPEPPEEPVDELPHGISNVLFIYENEDGETIAVKIDNYGGDIKDPTDPAQFEYTLGEEVEGDLLSYFIKAGTNFYNEWGEESTNFVNTEFSEYVVGQGTFGGKNIDFNYDYNDLVNPQSEQDILNDIMNVTVDTIL